MTRGGPGLVAWAMMAFHDRGGGWALARWTISAISAHLASSVAGILRPVVSGRECSR